MPQLFPIAAITDEFSPDISTAVQSMREFGITAAERGRILRKTALNRI
jgi:hypothetical protein